MDTNPPTPGVSENPDGTWTARLGESAATFPTREEAADWWDQHLSPQVAWWGVPEKRPRPPRQA